MAEPATIPRSEHKLSRRHIDNDALKVIYRLQQNNFETYLVGGGVRDLLLDRRPKDFDLGTSAHPQQIKRLFRNCWIIGRRFRLAHIKFGRKTLEVATFRKQVPPETDTERAAREAERERAKQKATAAGDRQTRTRRVIPRDNTFGTAEEDAFRRDFTINALFYDASTRSILDYVDGMRDIGRRTIRSIGDPNERFIEDPVRMLRAVVLAARLDLSIDPAVSTAIRRHRGEIVHSSPARLVEELYKIARSGASERIIRDLGDAGLLKFIAPELDRARSDALWKSLGALDDYRRRFDDSPPTLGNAVLLGSIVAPFATIERPRRRAAQEPLAKRPLEVSLGLLPIARRDLERLRQILDLQHRLADGHMSPRARQAIMHRSAFAEALTWMEIHRQTPELVAQWRGEVTGAPSSPDDEQTRPRRRRQRRRRRRRGPGAGEPGPGSGGRGPGTEGPGT
ncbi:MAG: polynucleotide adenylyltransferase PcnB [Acidobacteriota bacterium]|nr:polynucleotide adenylyltransferase PcnB [Acidobacteriota bacterium]